MERLSLVQSLLINNFELVKLADRKAQSLLRLTIGVLMIVSVGVPSGMVIVKKFILAGELNLSAFFISMAFLFLVCIFCLLMAMLKLIVVIRPRIGSFENVTTSLTFLAMAKMDFDDFRHLIDTMTEDDALDDYVIQLHQSSILTKQKYDCLNHAINWLLFGSYFGIIFSVSLMVMSGIL